jgi:hypothetical protein
MSSTVTALPQALGAAVERLDLSGGPAAVADDVAGLLHAARRDNRCG